MPPSSGTPRRASGGRWRRCRSRASTTRPRCCCPTGACCPRAAGSAAHATRSATSAKNAEVFSPPYLFQADGTLAPRPVIDSAPASIGYGAPSTSGPANPASITKVALVRLGAVTHSDNMEQRYMPLTFTAGATSLTATGAGQRQRRAARPVHAGHRRRQRRAVGREDGQRPGELARPTVTLTQPTNGATFTAPAAVSLAATASDPTARSRRSSSSTERRSSARTRRRRTGSAGAAWRRARTRSPRARPTTSAETDERAGDDHGHRHEHAAHREHHVPADGAIFAWKPTITITATASDPGRQRHEGGVPRRHDGARPGHDRALLVHVEERLGGEPRADRAARPTTPAP